MTNEDKYMEGTIVIISCAEIIDEVVEFINETNK